MKILHTSDWHIGRRLYSRKRYEEFEMFLGWLVRIVDENKIDIVVAAGDIFDNTTPGNRSLEIYYNFLRDLLKTDCSHIIIIGGNHDSPTLLNAPRAILDNLGVHVFGEAESDISKEVILLENKKSEKAVFCCVPYLRDRDVRTAQSGESLGDKEKKITEGIKSHYQKAVEYALKIREENGGNIPIIATGHLFATGGLTYSDDGVRELYAGSIGHIGLDSFPEEIDYLALGHLHIPQKIKSLNNFRYSGSPLPMGFNEANQKKKVIMVEFTDDSTDIKEIEIPVFKKLYSVKGNFDQINSNLSELVSKNENCFAEVIYEDNELRADLRQRTEDIVKGSEVDIVRIKNKKIAEKIESDSEKDQVLEELDVFEVFDKCLDSNEIPEKSRPELKQAYKEIVNLIYEEDKNAD
ncbi:MAG: exonuclease SbcCD subunit D C-terminal domain-containing protein [Thermodesulfobacteriota bacterium]